MKKILGLAAIGTSLLIAGCQKKDEATVPANETTSTAVDKPYTGRDWSLTATKTAAGGYQIGNPDAPVKLLEYASLTCPHCRDFTQAAAEPLKEKYVKSGKVAYEYRNFVLNPLDVAATLVARCQGPDTFFPFVEQLYATQMEWVGKFNSVDEKKLREIGALPQTEQFNQLIQLSGLGDFFKAHGVPENRIQACISNEGSLKELVAMREKAANEDKVDGTPNFFINGVKQDSVYDWAGLEAKLREHVR